MHIYMYLYGFNNIKLLRCSVFKTLLIQNLCTKSDQLPFQTIFAVLSFLLFVFISQWEQHFDFRHNIGSS